MAAYSLSAGEERIFGDSYHIPKKTRKKRRFVLLSLKSNSEFFINVALLYMMHELILSIVLSLKNQRTHPLQFQGLFAFSFVDVLFLFCQLETLYIMCNAHFSL